MTVISADEQRVKRAEGPAFFKQVSSPIGDLVLFASSRGVFKIGFGCNGVDSLVTEVASYVGARPTEASSELDEAHQQLDQYFGGQRKVFDFAHNLDLATGFRLTVVKTMADIPYGSVVSYAELAEMSGNAKAVRAAATSCAQNPLPIIYPCHRIVRSDGVLGKYLGGAEAKKQLLELETLNVG